MHPAPEARIGGFCFAAELRLTADLAIAFWMRKDAEAGDWVRLAGKGARSPRNYGVWEEPREGKRILFQQYGAGGGSVTNLHSRTHVEANRSYHIAVVVSGSDAHIYIDGAPDVSAKRSDVPATSGDPLTLGYAGHHARFRGLLDDVRVYDRALSPAEIRFLASAGE